MTEMTLSGGDDLERMLDRIARKISRSGMLRVGFLSSATYPDGTGVAAVAAINNFGAPEKGIPARPFFTNMIRENSGAWGDELAGLLEATNFDVSRALNMMGEHIAGQLRQSIVETVAPPNSPVTNLLKQRFPMGGYSFDDVLQAWDDVAAGESAPAGKPLVWTGTMLRAVDYEVEGG